MKLSFAEYVLYPSTEEINLGTENSSFYSFHMVLMMRGLMSKQNKAFLPPYTSVSNRERLSQKKKVSEIIDVLNSSI